MADTASAETTIRAEYDLERLAMVNALNAQIGLAESEVARKRAELAEAAMGDGMPNAATVAQCLDAVARAVGQVMGLRTAYRTITR